MNERKKCICKYVNICLCEYIGDIMHMLGYVHTSILESIVYSFLGWIKKKKKKGVFGLSLIYIIYFD